MSLGAEIQVGLWGTNESVGAAVVVASLPRRNPPGRAMEREREPPHHGGPRRISGVMPEVLARYGLGVSPLEPCLESHRPR